MTKRTATLKSIVYFLIVFLIVYCSHDTMLFGTNSNNIFIALRKVIPFIILFLLLVFFKQTFRGGDLVKIAILLLLPIISCLVNNEELNNYIYRFCLMADAFLLVTIKDKTLKFTKTFNSVITFLCLWSLVFWALSSLFPTFPALFPKIVNSEGNTYPNFLFSTVDPDSRYIFAYRNSGIFREPGVFACIICIAVLFELCRTDISFKRFWIYIITLVTTFSTAGLILAVMLIFYVAFLENKLKKKYKRATQIIIVIGALAIVVGGYNYLSSTGIFDKFKQGSDSYGSWFSRLQSVFGNLTVFKSSPVFGIGRYHLYETTLATQGNYEVIDNTNTYMINFAAFGFVYGFLCIFGTVRFFVNKTTDLFRGLLLTLILLVALSNEDFGQNIVYLYMVISGIIDNKKKNHLTIRKTIHQGELLNA